MKRRQGPNQFGGIVGGWEQESTSYPSRLVSLGLIPLGGRAAVGVGGEDLGGGFTSLSLLSDFSPEATPVRFLPPLEKAELYRNFCVISILLLLLLFS